MNIPKQAKRVFKGIIFDTYQWDQKLYDGSSAVFEMLKRPNTVQVIATIEDKIMIALDEQPAHPKQYTLVGGRQDPDETPLEGAKREFLEESGHVSDDWSEFGVFEPYHKVDWSVYVFIARNCTFKQEPDPGPGEIVSTSLITFDEFVDLVATDEFAGKEIATTVLRAYKNGTLDALRSQIFG